MALCFKVIPVTTFVQNCSIIWCDQSNQAVVIDPGGDTDRILSKAEALGLTLSAIWLTHGHIDHVGGALKLKRELNLRIIGPQCADAFWLDRLPDQAQNFGFPDKCEAFVPDVWLDEGDTVMVGQERLLVKHIPGHTPGHVVFCHEGSALLIAGDVLFQGSVGRSDFPMGNHDDLIQGIKTKLLVLPEETKVIPGHGPLTTIGAEKRSNPFLKNLF